MQGESTRKKKKGEALKGNNYRKEALLPSGIGQICLGGVRVACVSARLSRCFWVSVSLNVPSGKRQKKSQRLVAHSEKAEAETSSERQSARFLLRLGASPLCRLRVLFRQRFENGGCGVQGRTSALEWY